jgi:hypothetical protein
MSWRLWALMLMIAIVVMATLAIGLGVGLTRNDGNDNNSRGAGNGSGNDPKQGGSATGGNEGELQPGSPAGRFIITTNLLNTSTACTNVSQTWNCAPGPALNQAGINASSLSVVWTVTQENVTSPAADDDGFTISSVDEPFGLQFDDIALILRENGTTDEHWGFEATVRKRVRPVGDITGRNVAVECEFDAVTLSGRLFTKRQPDNGRAGPLGSWPGAVDIEESTRDAGQCFEVRNGVRGDRVDIRPGDGSCECSYADFDSS